MSSSHPLALHPLALHPMPHGGVMPHVGGRTMQDHTIPASTGGGYETQEGV